MKKLELIKGLSYSMKGFSAVKGEPFDVEDERADVLMGTGRFKEIVPVAVEEPKQEEKPVEKMKKDELIAYAEQNGIDISACENNDERVATIKAAIAGEDADDGAKAGFEE